MPAQVDDDVLRRGGHHPADDPAASLGGALPHPVPRVLMGDVQRGHRANRGGVGGEHAVGEGRRTRVARVHHEEKGRAGGHEAPVRRARLDVAPEVDHRLSAQMPEIVPLIVRRREHGDLGGPPLAVRAGRVAEQRAGEAAPVPPTCTSSCSSATTRDWTREGLFPGRLRRSPGRGR